MFSENEMIQRAAVEVMCNMMFYEEVYDSFAEAASVEKFRIYIALSGAEDFEMQRAASGALAIMSSSENVAKLMFGDASTMPNVLALLQSDKDELRHRGAEILKNLSEVKEVASELAKSGIGEAVELLCQVGNSAIKKCAEVTRENLRKAAA